MLSHDSTNMQKAFSLHSCSGPALLNDVIGLNNDFSLKERLIGCINIPHKNFDSRRQVAMALSSASLGHQLPPPIAGKSRKKITEPNGNNYSLSFTQI